MEYGLYRHVQFHIQYGVKPLNAIDDNITLFLPTMKNPRGLIQHFNFGEENTKRKPPDFLLNV